MKRLVIVMVLSTICHFCFSQPFSNERTARDYFLANIGSIDPIEGIYDIENLVVARSGPYSRTNRENYTIIIHQSSYNKFSVYDITSGGSAVLIDMRLERIGESSIYKIIIGDKKSIRFELDDLFSFGYSYNDSMGTAVSTVTFTAYKKYPTRSIYQEAITMAEGQSRIQEDEGWTGSGFALKDGYIATNYHVVEGATNILVQGVMGDFTMKYSARVVSSDKNNDLAIIKIDDTRFTSFGPIPYSVKTTIADVAEDIFVLGYPLITTMGNEVKYTTGVISSRSGYEGDMSQYQISAPVQPGNSGGPLFDSKGNLIGIVSAKHTDAENVGYAIKALYLHNLVDSTLPTYVLPMVNVTSTLSRAEMIKHLKNFVFLIHCDSNPKSSSYTSASSLPSLSVDSYEIPSTSNLQEDDVYLTPKDIYIKVGESRVINISPSYAKSSVTRWESDRPSIVSVDEKGNITALAQGSTSVWVYLKEGFAKRCNVYVE